MKFITFKGKQYLVGIMVIALFFLTAACGTSSSSTEKKSGASTTKLGDITFVVPYSAGGGFDLMARTLAPYMEKYLPDKGKIIVKNVPGGNGVIGINEVLMAKPDGKTIGIFNLPGFLVDPLVGKADYDLTKVEWLGQVSNVTYVTAASPKSGIKNLEDVKKLPEVLGGMAGLTDTGAVGAIIAADTLGFKLKPVTHKGSTEGILSAIRGDTQLVQFPYGSLEKFLVSSNDLVPLWVYSEKRLPKLPNTPTIVELGKPELLDVVSLRRSIGTTPGTSPEVLKVVRDALEKAMNDPELLKKMQDGDMEPQYMNAENSLKSIKAMKTAMEKYKSLFK